MRHNSVPEKNPAMAQSQAAPVKSDCGTQRRSFLQLGIPLMGLGLSDMLKSEANAAVEGRTGSSKSIIVFWTDGGLSQQDTYDTKPEAPSEYRGAFSSVSTSVPGVQLGELCIQQAGIMDRLAIIRSVHHENGIHAPSAHWMQTGCFGPTLARNAARNPSFGSIIARTLGSAQPAMPAYITMPRSEAFGYQGAVYLGKAWNPFEVIADPAAENFQVPNLSLPEGLAAASVDSRRKLLNSFDTLRRDIDSSGVMEGLDTFKRQALEMVAGDQMRAAFDISREDPALRDQYGRHRYGQSALLARRLIEAGARCVNINTGNWDHHNDIGKGLAEHLPPLDRAITALIRDLEQRGLLENVLVYCVGEFGRTPRMNGHAGRDHWSDCFSVMLAGGGVRGGQVTGASEKWGGGVLEKLVTPQDVLATVYRLLNVPLDTHFLDTSGRPVSIAGSGKPLSELI